MDVLTKISLCVTEDDLAIVAEAQRRIAVGGETRNRSEVLRIAIAQLSRMSDDELLAAGAGLTRLVPGRRPQARKDKEAEVL